MTQTQSTQPLDAVRSDPGRGATDRRAPERGATDRGPSDRGASDRRTVGDRLRQVGAVLAYSTLAFLLGIVGFVVVITLLTAGVGTVIIWIGIPILVVALLTAGVLAAVERSLQGALLGTRLPTPQPRPHPAGAGWMRRILTPLTDLQRWLELIWVLVGWVLAMISFLLMLTWTVGAACIVLAPVATLVMDSAFPSETNLLSELLGFTGGAAVALEIGMQVLAGLVFLLTIDPLARGLAWVHGRFSYGLLSSRFEEQQRLASTERSRAAGRRAESTALRRLERDLHDGPQQRLVRSSMDLARAEQLAETDPERSLAVLRAARTQLGVTLDELRRLSRGIAPPVLVDRGLPAALAELSAISPVPTTVDCPQLELPDHVEVGIYYVVSEALANAGKHAQASRIRVSVIPGQGQVETVIEDDGCGGAALIPEHGLAGLSGRVASLEGTFAVESPGGCGTRIRAVIPCAS